MFEKMSLDNTYINILRKTKERRGRALSMSVDWEKVVKRSIADSRSHLAIPSLQLREKPRFKFCTGSAYTGQWNNLGMSGHGVYNLFTDVVYEGSLKDGEFHGLGSLTYPNGSVMSGLFVNGRLVSYDDYKFADGKDLRPYCFMPDRRFFVEIEHGIRPAGRSYLTNAKKTRPIPDGCYDTGDGFYNPNTKCVYSAEIPSKIIRIPTTSEHNWIIKNCRKAWDEVAGYQPGLYEDWQDNMTYDQMTDSVFGTKSASKINLQE